MTVRSNGSFQRIPTVFQRVPTGSNGVCSNPLIPPTVGRNGRPMERSVPSNVAGSSNRGTRVDSSIRAIHLPPRPAAIQRPCDIPDFLSYGQEESVTPFVTRLELECVGVRWRVWHQGNVLIEATRDPEPAACRALLELGITGCAESYSRGGTVARMRLDIEWMAAVSTDEAGTPRFRRYRSLWPDGLAANGREFSGGMGRQKGKTAASGSTVRRETTFATEEAAA